MARTIHTLTIPSSTRELEKVRRFVETHAREANLSENDIEQVRVAVDEACTNVIKHAYQGDDGQKIDIAVIVTPDRFVVRIRDKGRPFNQKNYEKPDVLEFARRRKGGGLGVYLIRQLMDNVEYCTCGSANEVRLTKYRNGVDEA